MKNLNELLEILENNDISYYEYEEKGKLCGYELNAYTDAGVNEILFLDFRNKHQEPKNPKHFIKEFKDYINHYTVDDRIENNRKSERYKNDFTLQESLDDFTNFDYKLHSILNEMRGKVNEPEEVKIDFELLAKQKETLLKVIDNPTLKQQEKDDLDGILNLLDTISDNEYFKNL